MKYLDHYSLIQAYLSGQLSEREKAEFNDWLEASDSNRKLYHSVSRIWDASSSDRIQTPSFNAGRAYARHMAILESNPAPQEIKKGRIIGLKTFLRASAAVFIMALAAIIVFQWSDSGQKYAANDTEKIALTDGSDVWMSQGTELEFKSEGKERKANLTGKAYFDIEKDPTRPFVIEAGNTLVTVLGTKFIVDTRAGTVYVREGKVRVETGKASVILTANQKVSINDQSLSAVSTDNFDHADMWFNEDLIFNNSPFDKVINDIEKAFGIKIQLPSGRDWTKCTFTSGSLKNNRIEDIMTSLKVTYDLEYTQKDSHNYKISRVKCR